MIEVAYFGGGCFWCTEAIFTRLRGVVSVTPGYSGGETDKPSYQEVSRGDTKHAEVIKIDFDPKVITYESLLDVFFATHDPTTLNQQGADKGTQYRSIILYSNNSQKLTAEAKIQNLDKSKKFSSPIVTEVKKFDTFYKAESYHQDYYENNKSATYCKLVILPKIDKLNKLFRDELKR